jgi:hypothetical protein
MISWLSNLVKFEKSYGQTREKPEQNFIFHVFGHNFFKLNQFW